MFELVELNDAAIARRLFIFDMDGTLLPATTANLELAKTTDTLPELTELESAFAAGEISTKAFAVRIHGLWGRLAPQVVRRAFEGARKLRHIERVMEAIGTRGGKTCLITMSPDFFAEHFRSLGVHFVYASGFPKGLNEPLDTDKILSPEDKPVIARKLCDELGFRFEETVAFGDSMSDCPLFNCLTHTIAVNATGGIRRIARHCYDGDDLWDAFALAARGPQATPRLPVVG